ncbi:glycerol-3-phosphate dehydrogenase/oxidase [Botrimarina mediterranea]|uniref:Glycerol-3-phosphate dehydrogenase n=1 Tax=Botrimarina mediterranea TaxID=2528022 RepID=A0A518K817_9BACT|nr:glycerol-3-phosphate dehydrogenase/oxidase [Botrimarina mediterranea]QDV73917.1 Aerobic glycerol-3-phosphate dehydrogenase [Botrimarina mediterranea]
MNERFTTSESPTPPTACLEGRTLDVLVVGGGIVGAGVARDAAMRGLAVAVIDKGDFASGTSSRSSRLLHGGLRYLAQGRVGLVREASLEKRTIGKIAPHLAEPLAFVFPSYARSAWPMWKLVLGVKTYDLLCGMQNFGRSSTMGRTATLSRVKGLSADKLNGSVRYFDALTNDARLAIDSLRSAAHHGAVALNYTKLESAEPVGGFWRCRLATEQGVVEVMTRTVVNATGPWSDRIPGSGTALRLTKGVHLVVDRSRLPIPDAVVMAEGERILFAIPWGERVILGTTDTDYDGPLEEPSCDPSDIEYVLGVTNATFPAAKLKPVDVISTWSGLRPLVADPNGDPSDISRRHKVSMTHPGWWDVTGGKLTTYRLMAEETVDAIVRHTKLEAKPCATATKRVLDGVTGPAVGLLPPEVSRAAVEHYCRHEWARHLGDVMLRRTSWRHYCHDHAAVAVQVAEWMAAEFGWSDAQRSEELQRYRQLTSTDAVPSPHFVDQTTAIRNGQPKGHANGHAVLSATNRGDAQPAARQANE